MISSHLLLVSPRTSSNAIGTVLVRDNFQFSPGGTAAACIAGDGQGNLHLEAWSFTEPSPRWWPLPASDAVTPRMRLIPLDDGRLLLSREAIRGIRRGYGGPPKKAAEAHEIVLLDQIEGSLRERVLAVIPCAELVVLRLLPFRGPISDRWSLTATGTLGKPAPLAIAITVNTRVRSTIWTIRAEAPYLERLAEIPHALLGGAWLDCAGTILGVDRVDDGGWAKALAVDLRDGSWTQLLSVSKTSNDRLLACDPRSGLVVVSTDAPGEERLGWGRLDADEPVRFPASLHRPGHPAPYPLTFDQDGQRVLLHVNKGACSGLAVYTPAEDRLAQVEIPAGAVQGLACWTGNVLRFPFSTPCQPPGVATLHLGEAPRCSVAGGTSSVHDMPWADAHIECLDGAGGPIEAIVYGGEGWRTSRYLLLALHGGPVDAWRYEFDPLFQRLARARIAVIALNQRGSSGYGAAYSQAIRGAWGGPDLDDICCIGRALDATRRAQGAPRLMLLGESYGAFLALLATTCQPHLWSHCVALAPFLSGPFLYREAPAVRGLMEQLAGCEELHDDIGPRDVLRLCPALRARLLIVHGERDEMIPVTQSRALRQRLLMLGRHEGSDFEYLEILNGGHDLHTGLHASALHERVVSFLTQEHVTAYQGELGLSPKSADLSVERTQVRR